MFRKVYTIFQLEDPINLPHRWVAEKSPSWVLCTNGDESLLSDIDPNIDSLSVITTNGIYPLYAERNDRIFSSYEIAVNAANDMNNVKEEVLVCI